VALDYFALGLDPAKAAFFRQSDVPEVTELAWILGTVTNIGLLERAVSYKDKIDKGIDASVGLFTYPVLMAADILMYRADGVPVEYTQRARADATASRSSHRCLTGGSPKSIPTRAGSLMASSRTGWLNAA